MVSQLLFQNTFILRRPRVANFADIIKMTTMFIETTFKDSKKLKALKIIIKIQAISVFLGVTKVADFWWKNPNVNSNQGVCHLIFIFFGSSLGKV